MIRRNALAEDRQRRVAAALRQIAEHLIVRAVLLHDVEDVLDRRRLVRGLPAQLGSVLEHLPREALEHRAIGVRDQRQRPARARAALQVAAPARRIGDHVVARSRARALAVRDDQRARARKHAHRSRVPAGRQESDRLRAARLAHVEDRDVVRARVRDVQTLALRVEREPVGRIAHRLARRAGGAQHLDGAAGRHVNDRDAVDVRVGDEHARAVR